MSGDRKNWCGLGILIMGVVLLGSPALPKTGSVDGRSSLGIMQNSPPTSCWVETDYGVVRSATSQLQLEERRH